MSRCWPVVFALTVIKQPPTRATTPTRCHHEWWSALTSAEVVDTIASLLQQYRPVEVNVDVDVVAAVMGLVLVFVGQRSAAKIVRKGNLPE
jgi:hypothetical protein